MLDLQVDLECLKQAYRDARERYEVQQLIHSAAIAKGDRGCQSTVDRMESLYHRAARKLADVVCGGES